jgi:hypothetical protein
MRKRSGGLVWHAGLFFSCLAGLLPAGIAPASEAPPGGVTTGPVVVELFTSEGCSSCPPAEAVLGTLAARPNVIALGFHVTYWDSDAWRDRFARTDAVERQARYAHELSLASPYTPQLVVNGRVDVVGSDAASIDRAVARTRRPATVVLTISGVNLDLRLPEASGDCPCTLRLVGVQSSADTVVHGGENAGRTLREYRLVRSMWALGAWDGKAAARVVPLSGLAGDETSVVVLAESRRDASIVGAGEVAVHR